MRCRDCPNREDCATDCDFSETDEDVAYDVGDYGDNAWVLDPDMGDRRGGINGNTENGNLRNRKLYGRA
jgi:hypothetical protein